MHIQRAVDVQGLGSNNLFNRAIKTRSYKYFRVTFHFSKYKDVLVELLGIN